MSSGAPSKGLFDSAKRAIESLIALAQLRLELFSSELEAEKLRVLDALLQAMLGMVLLGLALVGLMGFVVLLFWDGYRLMAIGILVVTFTALGAWLMLRARETLLARDGGPFALTLGELRRDREELKEAVLGSDEGSESGSAQGRSPGARSESTINPAAQDMRRVQR